LSGSECFVLCSELQCTARGDCQIGCAGATRTHSGSILRLSAGAYFGSSPVCLEEVRVTDRAKLNQAMGYPKKTNGYVS
jgi:hypothetical protein